MQIGWYVGIKYYAKTVHNTMEELMKSMKSYKYIIQLKGPNAFVNDQKYSTMCPGTFSLVRITNSYKMQYAYKRTSVLIY